MLRKVHGPRCTIGHGKHGPVCTPLIHMKRVSDVLVTLFLPPWPCKIPITWARLVLREREGIGWPRGRAEVSIVHPSVSYTGKAFPCCYLFFVHPAVLLGAAESKRAVMPRKQVRMHLGLQLVLGSLLELPSSSIEPLGSSIFGWK